LKKLSSKNWKGENGTIIVFFFFFKKKIFYSSMTSLNSFNPINNSLCCSNTFWLSSALDSGLFFQNKKPQIVDIFTVLSPAVFLFRPVATVFFMYGSKISTPATYWMSLSSLRSLTTPAKSGRTVLLALFDILNP